MATCAGRQYLRSLNRETALPQISRMHTVMVFLLLAPLLFCSDEAHAQKIPLTHPGIRNSGVRGRRLLPFTVGEP